VGVTGLGAVTALGEGAGALWEAALRGRSGIDFVPWFDYAHHPEPVEGLGGSLNGWRPLAGWIRDFQAEKFVVQKKALKLMARDIQLAVAAASLALSDAGTKPDAVDPERSGVIVGSGVLNHELEELAASVKSSLAEDGRVTLKKFGEEGIPALFPLWLLKYLPNMPACHISIFFNLQGPNNTLTTGASAGLQAVGEAFRIIQRGAADVMLAGGAESKTNPVGLSQYRILGVLSRGGAGDPARTYRPFDANADGFVPGEGSGFLVLEEWEHARRRNARIYAEVVGFGSSSGAGREAAMKMALRGGGTAPAEIDFIQASGMGLPDDDEKEMEAMNRLFGRSEGRCVTAAKPVMGFTGFAAGAIDLILAALALREGVIPPTLNFERPRQELGFRLVTGAALKKRIQCAMTNAFGFNGQSASVVIRRC
ncbi:MAG: beta-ketoacyl-[acyl-carrier-protein] synthase family protein, partial [Candidatus Omnitrophica bacterium]|nr:beta-ketoacyl-[acyl-carrier-protein] synthase family protein [Candidatus Omnitrophota bacterium]